MRNNLFANWILSMFHWSLTSKWYLLHYTKTYFIGLNTLKKVPFVVQKHANCVYIPIGIYKWANLYLTLRNSEKNLAITSTSTIIIYGRILFSSANGIHVNCSTCVRDANCIRPEYNFADKSTENGVWRRAKSEMFGRLANWPIVDTKWRFISLW